MHSLERYSQAKKVTLLGALVNALLGVIKLLGGLFFHSHALAADGIHSFSDLFTDAMVLFASKYGSEAADDRHPYGHQRIETAATLLLSLLLILAGAAIAWDSLDEIIHHTHDMPSWITLPLAGLSILANESLFHYTHYMGKKIRSDLIIANAWHHRSDAASSIVVFIGLLGSMAGFIYLDSVAAVIVGLLIIKMGIDYGWNSVKELVDTAVDPKTLKAIENIISQIDGVQKIHQLRSRMMGRDIYIDVHVLVSPFISVSEGHFIAQHVHNVLVDSLEHVQDVTVHIDPEDDETSSPSLNLPSRKTLETLLFNPLQQEFAGIQSWVLHYLDGKLIIDILCSPNINANTLSERIEHEIKPEWQIGYVRINQDVSPQSLASK